MTNEAQQTGGAADPEGRRRGSTEQDSRLMDAVGVAVLAVDAGGVCVRWNSAAERLLGYTAVEMLGHHPRNVFQVAAPSTLPHDSLAPSILDDLNANRNTSGRQGILRSREGKAVPVEYTIVSLHGGAGAVATMRDLRHEQSAQATLQAIRSETAELLRQRDATSRVERELAAAESLRQREHALQLEQAAAHQLREQQELLQHVVDAAPAGIAVLDSDFRFRWHNRAFGQMLHGKGLLHLQPGQSMPEAVASNTGFAAVFHEVRRSGKPHIALAYPVPAASDRHTYWNWSLTRLPVGDLLLTAMDVTEQALAQQALVQSDKMAAVGRLAASISHEINNPLEAVTNLLYLVDCDSAVSGNSREYLDMAQTELTRVSRIASQTLRFHRHDITAVERTPQQLVDPVLALYQGKLKHARVHITVDFGRAKPLTTFEGDVRQILNNLIGNAIDAMDRGGELRVRTRSMHCARTGRSGVRITIADNGHGMNTETAAHIFEPFYTTKGASGSGLGLWISHTLAERHGGKLMVKSCPRDNDAGHPHGTTFSLFLPDQQDTPAGPTTIQ